MAYIKVDLANSIQALLLTFNKRISVNNMANFKLHRIKTVGEYHKLMGLKPPDHPLISVVNFESIKKLPYKESLSMTFDFYSVSLKRDFNTINKSGKKQADFDEGMMCFMAPGQVFDIEIVKDKKVKYSGWIILIHPDFLWNSPLAKTIKQYDYFTYTINEALYVSKKEESIITNIVKNIRIENQSNIDKFSQDLIIAQLELLLKYADRFYHRQFLIRKKDNHKILTQLDEVLNSYFNKTAKANKGIPSVQYVAETLTISPNYLSGLLRAITGRSTQQHIHDKLIEKAKEKLCVKELSISEIAYELGFEHPQSFSKLFKSKTNISPLEFRNSYN